MSSIKTENPSNGRSPFDTILCIITAQEWSGLEKGLVQRLKALNLFLMDNYGESASLPAAWRRRTSYIVPPGYLPQCE